MDPNEVAKYLCDIRSRIKLAQTMDVRERSENWVVASYDFSELIKATPHLEIRSGWRLTGLLHGNCHGGYGVVWAVPTGYALPPLDTLADAPGHPVVGPAAKIYCRASPKPAEASANLMDAFEGDGSPELFLEASLLYRELAAFGCYWHSLTWHIHHIITQYPWTQWKGHSCVGEESRYKWKFESDMPEMWTPCISCSSGEVIVKFYTYCGLIKSVIVMNEDVYSGGSLNMRTSCEIIATTNAAAYAF